MMMMMTREKCFLLLRSYTCWLVLPAFSPQHFAIHWMDIFVPAGLGGLWIAVFASQIPKRPLLPTGDPEFAEAMAHGPH